MVLVMYNPLADNNSGREKALDLKNIFPEKNLYFKNITEISDLNSYFGNLEDCTEVILAGGDGTLNKFVNNIGNNIPDIDIYYYPLGSGNDFYNDVKDKNESKLVPLKQYIEFLPEVTVKGKIFRFINGIGYGIDGYCCEEGDRQRKKSDKKINYTSIAVKGLFFYYHPANAVITVDGREYRFPKVYLAPSMNGRFYGGNMMITPWQDRLSEDGKLTIAVAYGTNRLNILRAFPSIFKGTHTKYNKIVKFYKGDEITVRFDRPTALQIDGETVTEVLEYTVKSRNIVLADKKEYSAIL